MAPMPKKWPLVALLFILGLAAFFRFYLITEIPPGLYPDEAANGNNALEALHTGNFKIFYPENNGREGLFINLQALAIKAFGPEPWALRVVSAIFGTLTVLGLYLLVKELFPENLKPETLNSKQALNSNDQNHKPLLNFRHLGLFRNSGLGLRISRGEVIALLASFFLATSYWHINFSRIGFRAIMVPLFATFGTYWLLKALRTGKISSAAAGGIAIGLGFHTYIAFRFMPLVFAVSVLFSLRSWLKNRERQPCVPCVIALAVFFALLAALPIGLYFFSQPADFFGRGGQISIFAGESPLQEFITSTILTLGMFNIWGDCNQRHNFNCAPQLFWPVGILFMLGFVLTIRTVFPGAHKSEARSTKSEAPKESLRDPTGQANPNDQNPDNQTRLGFGIWDLFGNWDLGFGTSRLAAWTLLVWFLVMMLPATLTREGLPHALRTIGMVVPAMIFAGLGAHWLWQRLKNYFDSALVNPRFEAYRAQLRRIQRELIVVAVLAAVWVPFYTYRTYFYRFANAAATYDAFSVDLWHQGQYLALLPPEVRKFVVVNLSGDDIRGVPAPAQTIMFATGTFEYEQRREKNIVYVKQPEEIPIPLGENTVLILMDGRDQSIRRAVRQRFPELVAEVPGDFMVLRK